MDPNAGTLIDQWTDPSLASTPGWIDCAGRSPVTLYLEYLQRRREWEARAWRLAGSQDPRFARALDELQALHEELSTTAPLSSRDQSVSKPPPRDHRKVRIVAVDRAEDSTVITTAEEEFQDLPPITYKVSVHRADDRWRLGDRLADHGHGRRLNAL